VACVYLAAERFPPNRKWRMVSWGDLDAPREAEPRFLEALLVRAHDAPDVERRQRLLLSLAEEVERSCRARIPGFPSDPSTFAWTRIFPDRQLRHRTRADEAAAPVLDQYEKMRLEPWSRCNWYLRPEPSEG